MARNNNERKQKNGTPPILIAVIVILCAAIVGVVVAMAMTNDNVRTGQTDYVAPTNDEFGARITFNGQKYRKKDNMKTVLFLGVDKNSEEQWADYNNAAANVFGRGGRADTIIVFLLDSNTETTQMLAIPRDTMTNVEVYDEKGDFAYSGDMQITMQHVFGDSPAKSLFLTKRTVGDLLYNIRIDGALSLTLDGIRAVVDMLGGIALTMPEDYTYIDERYYEGATVVLNGADMEHFVRYRDNYTGANDARMKRQNWLFSAVFDELKTRGATDFLQEVIDSDPDYITSDISADLLKKLSRYQILDGSIRLPGQTVAGELHDEFYVDEPALQQMIIDLLYEPVAEETSAEE